MMHSLPSKYIWQLMQNKDTLLYSVFKARFFPNGTILDTNLSARGSYAWNSIKKASHVITKGLLWRIGDGAQTCIQRDSWLPDPRHRKILSQNQNLPSDTRVEHLISPTTREWNHDLIDSLFMPYDAEAIKRVPLCINEIPDSIIQPFSINGNYTVRSAYHLIRQAEESTQPGTSNNSSQKSLQNNIWSFQVLTKVKNFFWRACSESLPTKLNLWKQKVLREVSCERCDEGIKNILHAVWDCKEVKHIWARERWTQKHKANFGNFGNLTAQILAEEDEDVRSKFAMIA